MTDNKLLITDDVKSAFADLLGRKPRDISNIKIEGKPISLHPNPIDINKQNIPQINNDKHINKNEPIHSPQQQNIFSSPNMNADQSPFTSSSLSSSLNSNTYSTPKTKPRSLSSSATPSRGSVLASYIQRFRNSPAINSNHSNITNTSSDFWWIKHKQRQSQRRPNTAPNTTHYVHEHEEKEIMKEDANHSNVHQVVMINNDNNTDGKQSSVTSSISDHIELLNAMNHSKPKQIEYKKKNISNDIDNSSKHSSIDNSPKQSIIESPEIKDEDSDSDKELDIPSSHYIDNDSHSSQISSSNYIDRLTQNENINLSTDNNDTPIDVDDILEKWRKKRRLKQLATENGMNSNFQHNHNNTLHYDAISELFNNNNDAELNRIKQRLGLLSNDEPITPSQPFTATIHPIPYPLQTNSNPYHSTFIPQHNNHYYHPTYPSHKPQIYTEPTIDEQYEQHPTTPIAQKQKPVIMNEYENKEEEEAMNTEKRKYLSPRTQNNNDNNFLMDQQVLREENAKTERLARIQRRMCCNEKKVLNQTKNGQKTLPQGRQKKLSPSPKQITRCKVQRKLQFEEKDDDDDDDEETVNDTDNDDDDVEDEDDDDVTKYLSKSVQTQPDVLTPKMNKIQSEKLKNNIIGIEETTSIHSTCDPIQLLPHDITEQLIKLEQDGQLKDEKDFDIHFKQILNGHIDNKMIANKLLKFMIILKESNENNKNDENELDDMQSPLKCNKSPLPSPSTKPNIVGKSLDDNCCSDSNQTENHNENENVNKNDNENEDENENEEENVNVNETQNENENEAEIENEEENECDNENEEEKQDEEDSHCTLSIEHNINEELLTVSHYSRISDIDDQDRQSVNQYDDEDEDEDKEDEDEDKENDDIPNLDISDSDIIQRWIEQHPDYYFEPSTQSDIQVIRNFVDFDNKTLPNVESNNDNDFVHNDYEETSDRFHQNISLNDDIEILTLIHSCKTLRNNISFL